MIELSSKQKAIVVILLIIGGIISGSLGVASLINAGNEFNKQYFEEKGISLVPEPYSIERYSRALGNTVPINFINYTAFFVTDDIFANGNSIDYSIKIFVENTEIIDRMVMFFYSLEDFNDIDFLDYDNIDWYMNTRINDNRAIELYKNSTKTFGISDSITPKSEHDVYLFLAIKQTDGSFISTQKGEKAFTVHPKTEKVQANLVRVTAEQIIAQQKNNDVMIGFSLMFLTTILLTTAFQIRPR